MKRFLALLLTATALFLMGITIAREVQKPTSQILSDRWEQVEEWQNKDLPRSTLQELRTIQQEAIGQSGITDRVKATFVAIETTLKIDREKGDSLVADLQNKIVGAETTVERTFLRFGLADVLLQNYALRQQKPSATLALTTLSDKELSELAKTKTIDYLSLLQTDSTWVELFPTLDDYFAKRQTKLLERDLPYKEQKEIVDTLLIAPNRQFLTYNAEQANLSPTVRAIIKSYQYLSSKSNTPQPTALLRQLDRLRSLFRYLYHHQATYRQSLEELLTQYHELPQSVEVVAELCSQRLTGSDEKKSISQLETYIKRFPDYPRIGLLKQLRNEILQGSYTIATPKQVYPNTPFNIQITFRKIKELNLTIRRISGADTLLCMEPHYAWRIENVLKTNNIKPDTTVAFAKQLALPFSFEESQTTVSLKLNNGLYQCDVHTAGEGQSSFFVLVNPYSAVARAYNGLQDIQVWDSRSWQPLPDIRIEIWDDKRQEEQPEQTATLLSDSYGRAELPRSTAGTMYRVVGTNGESKWGYLSAHKRTEGETGERKISLYTDRPAYRPGQRLRFEGVEWNPLTERPSQGYNVHIRLNDIYGKTVHQWNVTTNSFGSFTGELTLPQEIKSGNYYLQAEQSETVRIAIEEYKRPSLTIRTDKPICLNENQLNQEMEFQIDGTVTLTNGVGLSGTKIRYFLDQWGYTPDTLTATTDGSGRFSIRQKVKQQDATPRMWRPELYSPKLTITATDTKGESQTSLLHLATQPRVSIKTTLPNVLLAETSKEFLIKINRAFPATTEINGTYTIEQQSKQEQWKTVQTGEWKENGTLSINHDKQLKTGSYRILFRSSYFGMDSLLGSASTVIIHPQSKEMPFNDRLWSFSSTDSVDAGQPFELWVGSSWGRVWAMVELMNDRQFISRQFVPLNKNLNKLAFSYRPEWGKSVTVNVSAFVQGVYKNQQHLIVMRQPDKTLHIEIKTLRNKMRPGEKETWTLTVKDSQGKPVDGEVMATLYDASLNPINPLNWDTDPFFRSLQRYSPNVAFADYSFWSYHHGNTPLEKIAWPRSPIESSDDSFIFYTKGDNYEREIAPLKQSIAYSTATPKSDNATTIRGNSTVQDASGMSEASETEESNAIPIRRNFNESAFFYTQLRTNKKGEVKLPFTLPESLTAYSLRVFAHDRTLRSGYLESTIQVEKTILIGGNLPRFVYEGDSVRIKAIVFNLSKEQREIQTAFTLSAESQPTGEIVLAAGEQREVEFSFVVPTGSPTLSLTLTASTKGFGDAEQHTIPILCRSQKVHETRIFNFPQGGTFTIDKPFAQESIGRFDLTYIGSPLYHLLEAIPSSPMPQSESLISWLNTFYINHSAIQMEQRHASKQKIRATLEQLLTMQNRILAFQKRDGGFGWFECMPSSIMMTLFFLETTQRLGGNVGYDLPEEIKMAQIKALNFVDQELVKCYRADSIRSAQNQGTTRPSFSLQYMSVRGQFRDIPLAGATLTAHRYYFDQLVKERKEFSLAQKGLLASALFRYGRLDEAREVIRSLREYSVYTPDKGRYFANNRNPQFNNLCNVNTQTEIMEAFALNGEYTPTDREQTTNELKEMSTWLIYQKQGMDWGNEVATINALNAILTHGIDPGSFAMQKGEWASINLPIAQLTNEENASRNYSFAPQEWNKVSNQLTIKKKTTDYSRLMVTWERQSPLEKIKPSEGDLTIRQELIGTTPLQIGAATIRLTLSAQRDLDYIVVRSPRAACMEPTSQNSSYKAGNSLWYYHEIKDQGSNLYIEHLPRGTHTIDLPIWINLAGTYQQGVPTVESLFAPEFNGVGEAKIVSISPFSN